MDVFRRIYSIVGMQWVRHFALGKQLCANAVLCCCRICILLPLHLVPWLNSGRSRLLPRV